MLFEVLKLMENDSHYKNEKTLKMVFGLEKMILLHICIVLTKLDHTNDVYGFNLQCTHCNQKIILTNESDHSQLTELNKSSIFQKFFRCYNQTTFSKE